MGKLGYKNKNNNYILTTEGKSLLVKIYGSVFMDVHNKNLFKELNRKYGKDEIFEDIALFVNKNFQKTLNDILKIRIKMDEIPIEIQKEIIKRRQYLEYLYDSFLPIKQSNNSEHINGLDIINYYINNNLLQLTLTQSIEMLQKDMALERNLFAPKEKFLTLSRR